MSPIEKVDDWYPASQEQLMLGRTFNVLEENLNVFMIEDRQGLMSSHEISNIRSVMCSIISYFMWINSKAGRNVFTYIPKVF